MFKDFDTTIIDKYLKNNFPQILEYSFDGLMLLIGGTIKDLIMGKNKSKDLDFTLITQKEGNVKEFIKKYKLNVIKEINDGYVIKYNNIYISIKTLSCFCDAVHLNTDHLYYDIKRKQLIPIGIKYAIEKNIIIDYYYHGYYRPKKRIKKAKIFLNYLNHKKNSKVKYKYNRIYYLLRSFIKHPQKLFKGN